MSNTDALSGARDLARRERPLERLRVHLVYMLTEMGIETGVALEPLMDAADLLERLVDHPLNTQIERTLLADPGAAR